MEYKNGKSVNGEMKPNYQLFYLLQQCYRTANELHGKNVCSLNAYGKTL